MIPHARYLGLDPNFAGQAVNGAEVINETLGAHVAAHADTYDAVCAFSR